MFVERFVDHIPREHLTPKMPHLRAGCDPAKHSTTPSGSIFVPQAISDSSDPTPACGLVLSFHARARCPPCDPPDQNGKWRHPAARPTTSSRLRPQPCCIRAQVCRRTPVLKVVADEPPCQPSGLLGRLHGARTVPAHSQASRTRQQSTRIRILPRISSYSQLLPRSDGLPRSTITIPRDAHPSPAPFREPRTSAVREPCSCATCCSSSTYALSCTKVHVRQRSFLWQTLAFTLRTCDFRHAFSSLSAVPQRSSTKVTFKVIRLR